VTSSTDRRFRHLNLVWLVPLTVLVVGATLRFPGLADKPLHSDEGVNGWFTLRLYWWDLYRYRPTDYHGPFLYYVNLLLVRLFGPTEVALRMGTAVAGTLLPLALLPLRRYFGLLGLLCAGLLLACSPTMVYFARTNIHETYLLLATLLCFTGMARYTAQPSLRWCLLLSSGAALAFVNKETALLTAASLATGLALAWLLGRPQPGDWSLDDPDLFGGGSRGEALRNWVVGRWTIVVPGLLLFLAVLLLFFSSFFSWFPGILSFFEAFGHWLGYGLSGRNQGEQGWSYFAELLLSVDGAPLLVFAAGSGLWALWSRHRFGLLLLGWMLGSALVYSAIPYKTPWCALNIELPLLLLCAWGVRQLWLTARDCGLKMMLRAAALVALAAVLLSAVPLYQASSQVNREGFDDDEYGFVFVQTERGYYEFLQDLFGVGDRLFALEGRRPHVVNVDPKNPTRWYTITRGWNYRAGDYLNGKLPDAASLERAEIVLATGPQAQSVQRLIDESGSAGWHNEVYPLRPGVRVWAWFRTEFWDAYQDVGGRSVSPWPRAPSSDLFRPPVPGKYRR